MTGSRQIFVISHTHWDREWYRTFQEFRLLLTKTMDTLLDLMKQRPDFRHFLLDGQSVVLEDYLALRPERADEIRELVQAGRLRIGPWYVQPDEFLVSGEALIRNLLLGHKIATDLGGVSKVGWLPDTFGHIAQLPQILRGFDIDTLVTSRGLGDHLSRLSTEFLWEAPNGDRVLTLYQATGYWSAGNLGYPFFWGDTAGRMPDPALALRQVKALLERLEPISSTSTIGLWNGADHTPPVECLPDLISYLNDRLPGYRVRHGTVEELVKAVSADAPELQVVRGELRGSRYQNLHPAILSSRMHLKQANHRGQRLLERQVEPAAASAWLFGMAHPVAQLREAWRLLLQNHPHDSICGCSIDQVHREMVGRFDQSRQIAQQLLLGSLDYLAAQVDTAWCPPDSIPVLVLNTTSQPRREVVESILRLPTVAAGYRVTDSEGNAAQVQVHAHREDVYEWLPEHTSAADFLANIGWWRECLRDIDRVDILEFDWKHDDEGVTLHLGLGDWQRGSDRIMEQLSVVVAEWPADTRVRIDARYYTISLLLMANLPPCGYAVYAIEPLEAAVAFAPAVRASRRSLENEYIQVVVHADGGITITDKTTGFKAEKVHWFEDVADLGDCYDFSPQPESSDAGTLRTRPRVDLEEEGGLQATLRLTYPFRVPLSLSSDRSRRSAAKIPMEVVTLARLRAGSRYLEFMTMMDNQARDHRLRVLFPSGIDAVTVSSDGHFATTSRSLCLPAAEDWRQPPSRIQPHHTWFSLESEGNGIAVLGEGLPEHEVLPGEPGATMALTLLRCVGALSRQDLTTRQGHSGPARPTPDAQCIARHQFRYGVCLHGGHGSAEVATIAERFDVPLMAHPAQLHPAGLSPVVSLIQIEPPDLMLTALKCNDAATDLVLRFYNTGENDIQAGIRFGFPVAAIWRAKMSEEPIAALGVISDNEVDGFSVRGGEIVTLLVRPKRYEIMAGV